MLWRPSKIIIFILFLVVFACLFIFTRESRLYPEGPAVENYVLGKPETVLKSLSLEQKIGQLFVVGITGQTLDLETEKLLKEVHPGGILLLQRNVKNKEQLKNLISSLQKISLEDTGLPLFIAVDQEGGIISRLGWAEKTPQSEIKNKEEAYSIGEKRGAELAEAGVNLNLAPLLDKTSPGDFIFERCFQNNFGSSGQMAAALIQGQKENGVFSALKHFPGYGGISFNPEEELAFLPGLPEISQFQEAAKALPEMIMVSNVVYKEIDNNLPFSFSKSGMQFLKDKISSDYLIISDDLSQNSLLKKFSLKEIVISPINAGVDVLIFSGWRLPVRQGFLTLYGAAEKGEVLEERIRQSVLKIIEAKQILKDNFSDEI